MEVSDVLNKKLIFLNKRFNSTDELFDFIGNKATRLGLSKDSYASALKERELYFPTALEFNNIGVAIPHADSGHINNEFISLITLDEPIEFSAMEDSDRRIKVSIVFVLGLLKANDQLATLQAIMQLLQEENTLKYLMDANNVDDVMNSLNGI
ncbi:PTS sugar transporter subunit IIA [Tetragenococcus koreensis]|uniref:PTS sugar transporter IIA component n=1 Tax=Tetragenococcus koreensis TaxID=290335 RepID=A0AAN4UBF5_9ENTE|nr:PTS sugar transporter subunit IIA [Tetragenococcus koreensis]AYW45349.1 PTS sugar transporter subunit IIA [Tetragenococcus koreensis]MCF1584723.1 PTS sugar transporter subunit IIA [Tetragenococcus koreensis]MCF1614339.1 PTS sugar transporter subunit IIA [Tetragenococcus koreensis]MCF1617057.1 PTS sugar transporter subunit IIA [Tetragenococcus koreensis]MCF1621916.1 PTS sugar transporter subunit IIA [Tetragenococcus koreensis]